LCQPTLREKQSKRSLGAVSEILRTLNTTAPQANLESLDAALAVHPSKGRGAKSQLRQPALERALLLSLLASPGDAAARAAGAATAGAIGASALAETRKGRRSARLVVGRLNRQTILVDAARFKRTAGTHTNGGDALHIMMWGYISSCHEHTN